MFLVITEEIRTSAIGTQAESIMAPKMLARLAWAISYFDHFCYFMLFMCVGLQTELNVSQRSCAPLQPAGAAWTTPAGLY